MKLVSFIGIATIAFALATPALADHHGDKEKTEKQPAAAVYTDANGIGMVVYPEGYMLVTMPDSKTPGVIVKFKGDESEWTLTDVAGPGMCDEGSGKYSSMTHDDGTVHVTLISDDCEARKGALDGAVWTPAKHS